jgi:hypothetical protein
MHDTFSEMWFCAAILTILLCFKGRAPVHRATWVSCVSESVSLDGLDWSAALCATVMMTIALAVTLWLGHVCVSQSGVGYSVRHAVHQDAMEKIVAVCVSARTTAHVTRWLGTVPVHVAGREKTATHRVNKVTMGSAARRSVLTWYMVRKQESLQHYSYCCMNGTVGTHVYLFSA